MVGPVQWKWKLYPGTDCKSDCAFLGFVAFVVGSEQWLGTCMAGGWGGLKSGEGSLK